MFSSSFYFSQFFSALLRIYSFITHCTVLWCAFARDVFFALLLASLSDLFVFLIWPACWRWRGKMMSSTSLNSNPVDFRHRAWHYRLFSQVKFRDRKTTTKTQFQNKRNNLDISIRIHITHIHEVRHPQWIAGGNETGGRAHHWDKNDITLFDIFSKDDTSVRSKRAGRSAFTVTKFELFGVKLVNEHGIGCTYLFMFHVNFRVLLFSYLRCCCCYCCICCHGIYYYYYYFFPLLFVALFRFVFEKIFSIQMEQLPSP